MAGVLSVGSIHLPGGVEAVGISLAGCGASQIRDGAHRCGQGLSGRASFGSLEGRERDYTQVNGEFEAFVRRFQLFGKERRRGNSSRPGAEPPFALHRDREVTPHPSIRDGDVVVALERLLHFPDEEQAEWEVPVDPKEDKPGAPGQDPHLLQRKASQHGAAKGPPDKPVVR